jgi:hypothetical protein
VPFAGAGERSSHPARSTPGTAIAVLVIRWQRRRTTDPTGTPATPGGTSMALPSLLPLWIDIARTMLPDGRGVANARAAVERDRASARQRAEAEAALDRAARRLAAKAS